MLAKARTIRDVLFNRELIYTGDAGYTFVIFIYGNIKKSIQNIDNKRCHWLRCGIKKHPQL